jgi:adenylosuccinate lyase
MDPYENYQSPFSWRYGSEEMRSIWSEAGKRRLWRKIWVALARVQSEFGLVSAEQVQELTVYAEDIDMDTALKIESEIHHDLMAELKTFAGQCPKGGGALHLGATSMDIEDNADALRLRNAMDLVISKLQELLLALADRMNECADLPIIAFTHIQPAEPSTLGYRMAMYAQDLLENCHSLVSIRRDIRGKGFKGAVGTAAAYMDLLGRESYPQFETRMSEELGIPFFTISTQTYPRKQDYEILSALAGMGASLHKFALDLRLLQSPPIGEISEPFGEKQVGSSAMPFKRNPIQAEKIDSLARQLSVYPQVAWQNAANSLLERTLDDSANRRTLLPEAFLISDEILRVMLRLVNKFEIHRESIQRNLDQYALFACTERIMMAASRAGADRQEMHEILRRHALSAWQEVQRGKTNDLIQRLMADEKIVKWVPVEEIESLSQVNSYTGIAPERARQLAALIRAEMKE